MNYWEILGIEETDDLHRVKKAYAQKSKLYHPETHPDEFAQLHKAYKAIMSKIKSGTYSGPIAAPVKNPSPASNLSSLAVSGNGDVGKGKTIPLEMPPKVMKEVSQEEERQAFLLQVEQEAAIRDIKNSKHPQIVEFERMLNQGVIDKYWLRFVLSDYFLERQYEPELIRAMADMIAERLLQAARRKVEFKSHLPLIYMVIAYGCMFDELWKRKIKEHVYKKEQLVALAEAFRLDDIQGKVHILESSEKYLGEKYAFYVYRNILELLEQENPDREKIKSWIIDGFQPENTSHLLEIAHFNPKERYWANAKEHREQEKILRSPIIFDLMEFLIEHDRTNVEVFREALFEVCQMDLDDSAEDEKEILLLLLEEKTGKRRKVLAKTFQVSGKAAKIPEEIPPVSEKAAGASGKGEKGSTETKGAEEGKQAVPEVKTQGRAVQTSKNLQALKEGKQSASTGETSRFRKIGINISYVIAPILCILLAIFFISRNYYKGAYEREKPVSLREATANYIYSKEGYPADMDIPIAKSVEDIREYPYFTIEVSAEDIISTRRFMIKDITESGKHESKTRYGTTTRTIPSTYSMPKGEAGDSAYALRQVSWNMDGVSYGECCVITLESGERIFAYIDLTLLDLQEGKKIKLPIGSVKKVKSTLWKYLEYEAYQVEEENGDWYVDMVGNWEDKEVGDRSVIGGYVVCFIAALVSTSVACIHFEEERKKRHKKR